MEPRSGVGGGLLLKYVPSLSVPGLFPVERLLCAYWPFDKPLGLGPFVNY